MGLLAIETVLLGILYLVRENGSLFTRMSNAFLYDFMIGPKEASTATMLLSVSKVVSWVIVCPVFHEICFRGIGVAGYLRTGTARRAILWTTATSALLNDSPFLFPMPLVASFFYGVIRVRIGSVYCSLAAHCLNNLVMTAFLWGYMYHSYL